MPTDGIPLQEHLEAKIEALRVQICSWEKAHSEKHELEKEVLTTTKEASDMALNLNSSEIARRLEFLNGEAERLRQIQATYLPRELFEANNKDIRQALILAQKAADQIHGLRRHLYPGDRGGAGRGEFPRQPL